MLHAPRGRRAHAAGRLKLSLKPNPIPPGRQTLVQHMNMYPDTDQTCAMGPPLFQWLSWSLQAPAQRSRTPALRWGTPLAPVAFLGFPSPDERPRTPGFRWGGAPCLGGFRALRPALWYCQGAQPSASREGRGARWGGAGTPRSSPKLTTVSNFETKTIQSATPSSCL